MRPAALRPGSLLLYGRNQKGRSVQIAYCPFRGFLVPQPTTEDAAAAYLVSHGISRYEAGRITATIRRTAEAIDRCRAMSEFISLHCIPSDGVIPFTDFFARFHHFVPTHLKTKWTRPAVTQALPPDHRTVAAAGNRKVIPGLAWRQF